MLNRYADLAFRFLPIERDAQLDRLLHLFDVATGKALTRSVRTKTRDYADIVQALALKQYALHLPG